MDSFVEDTESKKDTPNKQLSIRARKIRRAALIVIPVLAILIYLGAYTWLSTSSLSFLTWQPPV